MGLGSLPPPVCGSSFSFATLSHFSFPPPKLWVSQSYWDSCFTKKEMFKASLTTRWALLKAQVSWWKDCLLHSGPKPKGHKDKTGESAETRNRSQKDKASPKRHHLSKTIRQSESSHQEMYCYSEPASVLSKCLIAVPLFAQNHPKCSGQRDNTKQAVQLRPLESPTWPSHPPPTPRPLPCFFFTFHA